MGILERQIGLLRLNIENDDKVRSIVPGSRGQQPQLSLWFLEVSGTVEVN